MPSQLLPTSIYSKILLFKIIIWSWVKHHDKYINTPPNRFSLFTTYLFSILSLSLTAQYNLTYTDCNSYTPYTFTNQILTHSPQLAAMIICPTVNETNEYTFVTHFRYNQRFKFLAWLNLKTRIHTLTHTPTPIYTRILTTTHQRNLNGFLPTFSRIFDFVCILSHFRFSISFHLLNCLTNVVINFMKP